MQYLLQLGNTPTLSVAEAKQVIGDSVEQLDQHLAKFVCDTDEEAIKLFEKLGASIRLIKLTQETQPLADKTIEEFLAAYLIRLNQAKFKLACAQLGDEQTERLDFYQLKQLLEAQNIKVRFVEGSRFGLSAAVLLHQKIEEFVIYQLEDQVAIGETIAIQNIDHWTDKDRAKPYADRKKGMLPPKLARAMVNLAIGNKTSGLVYDPFCGTGTVLIEALELGLDVVGSDLDQQAVIGATTNLAWFKDKEQLAGSFAVFHADVSQVKQDRFKQKVDYLVTEPFLGKPKPKIEQLPDIFKGLEKLYLGAFKQWKQLLNNGSKLVVIFPRVETGKNVFDLSGLIDKLSGQGYTLLVNFGELRYHRKDAVVQRDILIFEYHH
ncbi:MAG: TRM11 family SAM-dependent methyltransferase [Patescibacteria group bacterium]